MEENSSQFLDLFESQEERFISLFLNIKEEAQLSSRFDRSGIQESFRFRALYRARKISNFLLDENGEVNQESLTQLISWMTKEGFIFYLKGENDCTITEHLLSALLFLKEKEVIKALKKFQPPVCHSFAKELVLETLGEEGKKIDRCLIRKAALCALLTPLRQNVGSCFATAPAILIQKETPLLFLEDLYQLLSTGKLKRTFGGIEHVVPLTTTLGIGDLRKPLFTDEHALPWESPSLKGAIDPIPEGNTLKEMIQSSPRMTIESFIKHFYLKQVGISEKELLSSSSLQLFKGAYHPSSKTLTLSERYHTLFAAAKRKFNHNCDNSLLKSWELSLASFSEVKMEFSNWNLYTSLGLAIEEEGGIGEVIFQEIHQQIKEANVKIETLQKEYERAFNEVRTTEALLRNAGSESQARRVQAEYQSRLYHMRSCETLRDEAHSQSTYLSTLYSSLIKEYFRLFPDYFQEVYDAEMQDIKTGLYADSPAGFRLMYKHGRSDPSSWELIQGPERYIHSLVDFFSMTELQVMSDCAGEKEKESVRQITTAIISHVKTAKFLETAFHRMAKAHKLNTTLPNDPFLIEKKPWAYISGGTMATLLKVYYRHEGILSQEERWVESESELLTFLIDTLKNLPPSVTTPFLQNPYKGMLISSPTHAFVLLPGKEKFKEGWQSSGFSYTWVRDKLITPSRQFYEKILLTQEEQIFLMKTLGEKLSHPLRTSLIRSYSPTKIPISPSEFRTQITNLFPQLADTVDSHLFESLPLTPSSQWKQSLKNLLSFEKETEQTIEQVILPKLPFLTAYALQFIAKKSYVLSRKSLLFSFDLHQKISDRARTLNLAPPSPLLFADTNWTGFFFAFLVNPGTNNLELWRVNHNCSQGAPMSSWKQWLNGSTQQTWTIYRT